MIQEGVNVNYFCPHLDFLIQSDKLWAGKRAVEILLEYN